MRLFLVPFCVLVISSFANAKDPYEILGVYHNASPTEIKQAYKGLVKFWHPDKNKKPNAERQFIEINRAYAVLSDPDRKLQFDRYGNFDDGENQEDQDERNPFADFHFGSFGQFHYQFHSEPSSFKKHEIGLRIYENTLVNRSYTKPYLIFAYADWCSPCMRAERLWEHVVSVLEPEGYGIATVNSKLEGALVENLRIRHLPAVVALVDGHVLHFRGRAIEAKGLLEFARLVLPKNSIANLNDVNYRQFLEGNWRWNKMSAIICSHGDELSLQFLLSAMRYRSFFAFGSVTMNSSATAEFRAAYGLSSTTADVGQSLLLFNERTNAPLISVRTDESMSTTAISSFLESNKYLILPRLSSQQYFDDLCPPSKTQPRLCVLLLVQSADKKDDVHVIGFRDTLAERWNGNDVRYAYVYKERQSVFVESLAVGDNESQSRIIGDRRHVIILWRTDVQSARVHWLRNVWSGSPEALSRAAAIVSSKVESIRKSNNNVTAMRDVVLKPLIDEDHPTVYKRLASRVIRSWESFLHHVGKDEFLPAISIFGTLLFMVLIGYCLNHVVDTEKRADDARRRRRDRGKPIEETKEFKTLMRELRAETYFGMLRMLKPGFRSIVVLVDEESKDLLVKQFARAIWPWRKNKTLLFGFVMVEKNLDWFRQLLEAALGDPDSKLNQTINPRNVIGTVLSLNGFRQFFCIYHPKHAPSMVGFKNAERRRPQDSRHFLDFDSGESTDDSLDDFSDGEKGGGSRCGDYENAKEFLKTKCLRVDELLDGLPNWLERLFRGSARRYYVAEWPQLR